MDIALSDTGTDVDDDNCENLENYVPKVLDGVIAYVDVWSGNENLSSIFRKELTKLGATVLKRFSNRVTHVIFKEGNHQTVTKAQKAGIHLLSVLWVDSCKKSHKHVLENEFPATTPKDINPLFPVKRKRAKKNTFLDYDEEKALFEKQLARRHKKQEALRLMSGSSTPTNSPMAAILVTDTQPRSPESGFRFTPIRLAIPETPPSMREKIRQLRLAKQAAESESGTENLEKEMDTEMRQEALKPLQKKLFLSQNSNIESSPDCSPVFPPIDTSQAKESSQNTSVTDDILQMAESINSTLSKESSKKNAVFGVDSDENLLSSQEICTIAGKENVCTPTNLFNVSIKHNSDLISGNSFGEIDSVKSPLSVNKISVEVSSENSCESRELISSDLPVFGQNHIRTDNNESKNPTKSRKPYRPRSTRRFSVHQVVDELDKTANKITECLNDLDEDPIPSNIRKALSCDPADSNAKDMDETHDRVESTNWSVECNEGLSANRHLEPNCTQISICNYNSNQTYGTSKHEIEGEETLDEDNKKKSGKNKSGRRKSVRKSVVPTDIEKAGKRRRSCIGVSYKETDVGNTNDNEDNEENNQNENTDIPKTQKRTTKKKLMSLSDLNDQHSVLVEPSKCSQNPDRAILVESGSKKKTKQTKATKGKGKKTVSEQETEIQNEADVKSVEDCETIVEKGAKRSRKQTGKGKRRKSDICDLDYNKKATASSLADDTQAEVETEESVTASEASRTQCCLHSSACTTHHNATKDSSIASELRDSALSMSMSRAYPNSPGISSISQNSRKSIDDFTVSQRKRQRKQRQMKRFLTSVAENESGSTDSDTSSKQGQRRAKGNNSGLERSAVRKVFRPSLVMTSLHSFEQDVIISVVKKLGGFIIAESVNETTTHVICGNKRRTLNVLQCIARGVWLVSQDWVLKSLEAGSWQDEMEYECTDLFPACKVSRLEKEKSCGFYRQTLFMGLGHIYVSGRSNPPRDKVEQLIKLCGGQVTGSQEKCNIYIGTDYHPGLTCLKTSWVIECISQHKTLPMEMFMLDRPKKESSPEY